MDLTIITVTYQAREYIADCILSVVEHTLHIKAEHIVIDNGSSDGTCELIEKGYLGFVKLIRSETNLGFARANALGVAEAKGKHLLFLNPDMRLHEGYLDTLVEWIKARPDVGVASCKLLNFNGDPHPYLRPMRFPQLFPYLKMFLGWKGFFCTITPELYYEGFQDDLEQEVEVVRGSFMLMPREVVDRIGFAFDPSYFILFEDIDICQHMRQLGLKVVYAPIISCIDLFGRSFTTQTKEWKQDQMVRSLKLYLSKWHSPLHKLWINLLTRRKQAF